MASASQQLEAMIDRFAPEIAALARGVLVRVRRMLPGAVEMVYDNAYALVVGFGATDRASEAVVSVVIMPRRVSVCFLWGADLADPDGLLQGTGRQVRHVRVERIGVVDDPKFKRLVRDAVGALGLEFGGREREVQIRAESGNRRGRRVGEKKGSREGGAAVAKKKRRKRAAAPGSRR